LKRPWIGTTLAVAGFVASACRTFDAGVPFEIPPPAPPLAAALERYAPILIQEQARDPRARRWDRPTAFDPDESGTLADDHRYEPATSDVPFYAAAREDGERLYLFYGLYYPVDWSGDPRLPRIDHRGDFEGALVVVSKSRNAVEAVITQAHKRFYLWPNDRRASSHYRGFPVASPADPYSGWGDDGRGSFALFSESGGHGLYARVEGEPWHPKGGRAYPHGTAAVPWPSLLVVNPGIPFGVLPGAVSEASYTSASIRPLSDLMRFVDTRRRRFKDLPRGATPPWFWKGGGAPEGAIVRDPGAFYRARLRAASRSE